MVSKNVCARGLHSGQAAIGQTLLLGTSPRWLMLCVALWSTVLARGVYSAEPPWPGVYLGTYHVDRWLEPRLFGVPQLGVPSEIAKMLRPFRGQPVAVDVSGLDGHPTGHPSKASIREVRSIRELPQVARVQVQWTSTEHGDRDGLRQLSGEEPVELKVHLTNRDAEPLVLEPSPLVLILHRVRPSESGIRDPLAYWSGFRAAIFKLVPANPPIDVVKDHHRRWPAERPEHPEILGPGESRSWTFTLTNIPPNEYEVAAAFDDRDRASGRYVRMLSNWLRLDVLAEEPMTWQGLRATLERDESAQLLRAGGIPMRVRFANTSEKPVRFNLRKYRGHWVVSQDLLVCYDERGTLLPVEDRGGPVPAFFASLLDPLTSIEQVRLERGSDLLIPVELPPGTRMARVAFQHRFDLTGRTAADEEAFEGLAYVFSPHVLLKAQNGHRPNAAPPQDAPVEAPRPGNSQR